MSDFSIDFDLNEVAPVEFEVLPAGKHRAVVTGVDIRPDYDGTGKTLWVKLTFLDGSLKNRKTVAFLDVHSATDWKQTRGRQSLVALSNAIGLESFSNYAALVTDTPVGVVISHYKTRAGEVKDQVKTFVPASEVSAVVEGGPSLPSQDSDNIPF